jgi:hypothetical protein
MTNTPEHTLDVNRYGVGAIRFPAARSLQALRTLDGLVLTIPGEIELHNNDQVVGKPLVLNVRAAVSSFGEQVGIAEERGLHAAECKRSISLALPLAAQVLRELERRRNGGDLTLLLELEIRLCVLRSAPFVENGRQVFKPVQGEPVVDYSALTVTLEARAWANMLNATGFGENVFVEIPIPPCPGPPWDEVWRALRNARDMLNRGGTTAWKGVISECRTAMEKWRHIEADLPPTTDDRDQRNARTWRQRLDHLRWHLHHLASDGVHGHADEYERKDAVLVLATLAGLLAVRNP